MAALLDHSTEIQPGQRVTHRQFGDGVIVSVPLDGYARVFFQGGERQVAVASLSLAIGWAARADHLRGENPAVSRVFEAKRQRCLAECLPMFRGKAYGFHAVDGFGYAIEVFNDTVRTLNHLADCIA